ncbi:MAG: hypothetical protein HYU02_07625 [Thaumarchaeota archaeon]|nr:hypothetical protein [Nitrososphaerota archaeon]
MTYIELEFEYDSSMQTVFDWWTDLSSKGYVGKSLKSIEPVGKEGEKVLVRTKWVVMGFTMHLNEKLTLDPPNHWVWEPHIMGIDIIDDFRLEHKGEKLVLHIHSESKPRGMKGRLASLMLGWLLDRMMVNEWVSADQALRKETDVIS